MCFCTYTKEGGVRERGARVDAPVDEVDFVCDLPHPRFRRDADPRLSETAMGLPPGWLSNLPDALLARSAKLMMIGQAVPVGLARLIVAATMAASWEVHHVGFQIAMDKAKRRAGSAERTAERRRAIAELERLDEVHNSAKRRAASRRRTG